MIDYYFTRLIKKLICPMTGEAVVATTDDKIYKDFNIPLVEGPGGLLYADLSLPEKSTYEEAIRDLNIRLPEHLQDLPSALYGQLVRKVKLGFSSELESNLLILTGEAKQNYLEYLRTMWELRSHYERYNHVWFYYSRKVHVIHEYEEKTGDQQFNKDLPRYQLKFFLADCAFRLVEFVDSKLIDLVGYEMVTGEGPGESIFKQGESQPADIAFEKEYSALRQKVDRSLINIKFLDDKQKDEASVVLTNYFFVKNIPGQRLSIPIYKGQKSKLMKALGILFQDIENAKLNRQYCDFATRVFKDLEDEIIGNSLNSSSIYKGMMA